jgi:hypothetical protein
VRETGWKRGAVILVVGILIYIASCAVQGNSVLNIFTQSEVLLAASMAVDSLEFSRKHRKTQSSSKFSYSLLEMSHKDFLQIPLNPSRQQRPICCSLANSSNNALI